LQPADEGTHLDGGEVPELVPLRLLGIICALIVAAAAEGVATADVDLRATSGLLVGLGLDETGVLAVHGHGLDVLGIGEELLAADEILVHLLGSGAWKGVCRTAT
jgi:hypothetical protein